MRDFIRKIDDTAPAASGILGAIEDNARFSELKNAVSTSGVTLDDADGPDTDVFMLAEAMARYASGGLFCVDSGGVNTIVLDLSGSFQEPKAYFTGLRVIFYVLRTSTGASTVNAFGLGSKQLLRYNGTAIQANDLLAGRLVDAFYDATANGGSGAFKLAPWAIPASLFNPSATPLAGEGISIDNQYHISLNFQGLTISVPVSADVFAFYAGSAAHHRAITLANLIAAISPSVANVSLATIAPMMRIEERRPNLTTRTMTAATWAKRPLSVDGVTLNQIAGASLNGANQIILPAGTYRANFAFYTGSSGNHRTRLFNVTTQTMIDVGNASDSDDKLGDTPSTASICATWFTLASQSTLEVQTYSFKYHGTTAYFGGSRAIDTGTPFYVDGFINIIKEA